VPSATKLVKSLALKGNQRWTLFRDQGFCPPLDLDLSQLHALVDRYTDTSFAQVSEASARSLALPEILANEVHQHIERLCLHVSNC
jgi:hypothetical protein